MTNKSKVLSASWVVAAILSVEPFACSLLLLVLLLGVREDDEVCELADEARTRC